jgi:8-oxo-dGTP pyrophosphatase MutT (NUDIX family)
MIKFNNTPNKAHTTDDTITVWNSRSVAVVGHIWCKYEGNLYVLIGKRGSAGDEIGKYNIPCGYLDWNENLQEATRREVYEETDLDISSLSTIILDKTEQPWFVSTDVTNNRQNIVLHTGLLFKSTYLPTLSNFNAEENEVESVEWMKISSVLLIHKDKWAFDHYQKVRDFYSMCIFTI